MDYTNAFHVDSDLIQAQSKAATLKTLLIGFSILCLASLVGHIASSPSMTAFEPLLLISSIFTLVCAGAYSHALVKVRALAKAGRA